MEGIKAPKPLIVLPSGTDYDSWLDQFEFYAAAIELEKKSEIVQFATFMTTIGPAAQNIFKTFQIKEGDKKCSVLKEKFKTYFNPKSNITFERYVFNTIVQKEDQTFEEFLTSSRAQIIKCKFGQLEDELLMDKVVIGVHSQKIRERLLSDENLTLEKAIGICRSNEIATRQMSTMSSNTEQLVDFIGKNRSNNASNLSEYKNKNVSSSSQSLNKNKLIECQYYKRKHIW